jgi:hypothetical protein
MIPQYLKYLCEMLIKQLFAPEYRQFHAQVDRLIDENDVLIGRVTEGFNYLGTNYGRNGRFGFMDSVTLNSKLAPRMGQLIHFMKQMELEKQLITQIVYKLIGPCKTSQDIRDALPECLVGMFDNDLKERSRTRDPAWTLTERDMRQYRKILPKIETYATMKFLY